MADSLFAASLNPNIIENLKEIRKRKHVEYYTGKMFQMSYIIYSHGVILLTIKWLKKSCELAPAFQYFGPSSCLRTSQSLKSTLRTIFNCVRLI